MERDILLAQLTSRILATPASSSGILRVGIDGPDAAGKTTLARELAPLLQAAGKNVIRSSIDCFHQPRRVRWQQGDLSPLGYYEDSFDLPGLHRVLLDPLAPDGNRRIKTALFDLRTDSPLDIEEQTAVPGSILLFDGIFILRPELLLAWDFTIFIQVSFETILKRAEVRDTALFGSPAEVRSRYLARYLPAQQLYLSRHRPDLQADAVIINDDPTRPTLQYHDESTYNVSTHPPY